MKEVPTFLPTYASRVEDFQDIKAALTLAHSMLHLRLRREHDFTHKFPEDLYQATLRLSEVMDAIEELVPSVMRTKSGETIQ